MKPIETMKHDCDALSEEVERLIAEQQRRAEEANARRWDLVNRATQALKEGGERP